MTARTDRPAASASASARAAALNALLQVQPAPTDLIEFSSQGRALILAPAARLEAAQNAARALAPALAAALETAPVNIGGYFGAFAISPAKDDSGDDSGGGGEIETRQADIIIDYHTPPLLMRQNAALKTLPLGYFAAGAVDAAAEARLLQEARDLRGTFTKPRYFSYQEKLCAHSAAEISGCTRCLQACTAQAITSAGDKIAVNPHLCQGCGSCVMTCPSGALRYAYPAAADMLEGLRAAIRAYNAAASGQENGQGAATPAAPALLFYAAGHAEQNEELQKSLGDAQLPPHILPIAVEEIGAAGLEIWFAALAFGAAPIAVYADNPAIAALVREQQAILQTVLNALIPPPDEGSSSAPAAAAPAAPVLSLLQSPQEITAFAAQPPRAPLLPQPATFAVNSDKRQMFFMALNHFCAALNISGNEDVAADVAADAADTAPAAGFTEKAVPLPSGAPFGLIHVAPARCTLCMACAGACPASAVRAGNSAPRLTFVEENCVQCRLCEKTCPEDAITLAPRLNLNKDARRQARLLHEDKPLHCLRCQKPFASERIVSKIEDKLKSHWMFSKPADLRRLRLCEDCRVKDMFDGGGGNA